MREAPVRTHHHVENTISSWQANNVDSSPSMMALFDPPSVPTVPPTPDLHSAVWNSKAGSFRSMSILKEQPEIGSPAPSGTSPLRYPKAVGYAAAIQAAQDAARRERSEGQGSMLNQSGDSSIGLDTGALQQMREELKMVISNYDQAMWAQEQEMRTLRDRHDALVRDLSHKEAAARTPPQMGDRTALLRAGTAEDLARASNDQAASLRERCETLDREGEALRGMVQALGDQLMSLKTSATAGIPPMDGDEEVDRIQQTFAERDSLRFKLSKQEIELSKHKDMAAHFKELLTRRDEELAGVRRQMRESSAESIEVMEKLARDQREEVTRLREKNAREMDALRTDAEAARAEASKAREAFGALVKEERAKAGEALEKAQGDAVEKLQEYAEELAAAAAAENEVLEHRRRREVELLRGEKEQDRVRQAEEAQEQHTLIEGLQLRMAQRDTEAEKNSKFVSYMEETEATLKIRLKTAEQRTVQVQSEAEEGRRTLRQEVEDARKQLAGAKEAKDEADLNAEAQQRISDINIKALQGKLREMTAGLEEATGKHARGLEEAHAKSSALSRTLEDRNVEGNAKHLALTRSLEETNGKNFALARSLEEANLKIIAHSRRLEDVLAAQQDTVRARTRKLEDERDELLAAAARFEAASEKQAGQLRESEKRSESLSASLTAAEQDRHQQAQAAEGERNSFLQERAVASQAQARQLEQEKAFLETNRSAAEIVRQSRLEALITSPPPAVLSANNASMRDVQTPPAASGRYVTRTPQVEAQRAFPPPTDEDPPMRHLGVVSTKGSPGLILASRLTGNSIGTSGSGGMEMLIQGMTAGSPAAVCGQIQAGDVLAAVDGIAVGNASVAEVEALMEGEPGSQLTLFTYAERKGFVQRRRVVLTRLRPSDFPGRSASHVDESQVNLSGILHKASVAQPRQSASAVEEWAA